ncbi:chitinase [Streptomyces sp. NPDC057430]|uniref:chitinase n=1 Tax=Streptomyces sp. NPDC057430 TaxID=3346131 RepID=UPI003697AEE2
MPPHQPASRPLVAVALCALALVAASSFALGRLSVDVASARASSASPTPAASLASSPSLSPSSSGAAPQRTPRADRAQAMPGMETGTGDRADFSPYVDTSLSDARPLVDAVRDSGVREFTLAFVVAEESGDGCSPSWGGHGLRENPVAAQIGELRRAGADVRVSFGGADGVELGAACPDEVSLADAYREVLETYALTKVDFDIEGDDLGDTAANDRRSRVIALLQGEAAAAGRPLQVTFTLPVMPEGLSDDGTSLLESAVGAGVQISGVNIMTMNYGTEYQGNMAEYALEAARAVHAQLRTLLGLTDTAAWKALELTPMIGLNDIATEAFRPDDAERLLEFARTKGLGRLSMWSAGRDRPCPGGPTPRAVSTCSSIEQQDGEFLRIFAAYRGPGEPAAG